MTLKLHARYRILMVDDSVTFLQAVIAMAIQNNMFYRDAVLKAGADEFIPKESIYKNLIPTILRVQRR